MSYTTMHWNKSFGFVCVRCLGKLQEGHLPPDEMCVKCILGQPVPFDFPPDFYAPRDSHQKLSDTAHDHLLAGMDTVGPVKDDSSKNRMDLIPAKPLLLVGEAFSHGARKYAPNNFRLNGGLSRMRLFGALLRHAYAWASGEDKDKDSGLPHLSHAIATGLMIMDLEIDGIGEDDREKRP